MQVYLNQRSSSFGPHRSAIVIERQHAFVSSLGDVLIGGYPYVLHCPPRLLLSNGNNTPGHSLVPSYACGPIGVGYRRSCGNWTGWLSSCGSMTARGLRYEETPHRSYRTLWWHCRDRHGLGVRLCWVNVSHFHQTYTNLPRFEDMSLFRFCPEYPPSCPKCSYTRCWY